MMSNMGVRSMTGSRGDGFGGQDFEDFEGSTGRRQEERDNERELSVFRSGSAPPTVEGSLTAVGEIFRRESALGVPDFSTVKNGYEISPEEELLSNPAYISYYYSNMNLNPRLPPPVLSKEDWRSTQRLLVGDSLMRGMNDGITNGGEEEDGGSLLAKQAIFSALEEQLAKQRKIPGSGEWVERGDGFNGLLLRRQMSFADVVQHEVVYESPSSSHPLHLASHNAFANGLEQLASSSTHFASHKVCTSVDGEGFSAKSDNGHEKVGTSFCHNYASVVSSSLQRSNTMDTKYAARATSLCFPQIGSRIDTPDRITQSSSSFNVLPSDTVETDDVSASLSNINLSTSGSIVDENITKSKILQKFDDSQNLLFASHLGQNKVETQPILKCSDQECFDTQGIPKSRKSAYIHSLRSSGGQVDLRTSSSGLNGLIESQKSPAASINSYLEARSCYITANGGLSSPYENVDASFAISGLNADSENPGLSARMINHVVLETLPLTVENTNISSPIASPSMGCRTLGGRVFSPQNSVGQADFQTRIGLGNPTVLQASLNDSIHVEQWMTAEYAAYVEANCSDPSFESGYLGPYADVLGIQKAYNESLFQTQKQYAMPNLAKSGVQDHNYYGNPGFCLATSYPGSPLASSISSPFAPGNPLSFDEKNMCYYPNLRNLTGGVLGSWHSEAANKIDGFFPSSILGEFKSNRTRCFELCEIAGHVIEFSTDQYGSRFIQQKLETATTKEKNMVFDEIMPHALSLMTDVFGNYVVQKFFEHGSSTQKRELANHLNGHVLALSLQMYGCRVIQKAIEVVDLDQKVKMVSELDGHVMYCVRDQNGNHVIQKCIECVPQDAIQFIISTFYNQVVTLSTHPYGCRVIQRVLEHCDNPNTQHIVVDEILQSVCMLAQDQYGNYVVQHVLEHGKPDERSVIIRKLTGRIVQMSQQKFASNVIEKCLFFGNLQERKLLVNEILGSTDENQPLQVMMKDQFANYVVQKVLETCDDQQRELILSRIKVHLDALKKYTYGKHIVARVEKLVVTGEKRIGLESSYPSQTPA
ncbi:pumilio homolog 3-like [Zingiber officinale]|uniref:pumilio homolog 3-like n=1 Tax=Zingiber officinale TaxID=94328 RepID=UPI001C4C7ED6|nr:pumilio homolog 3-like [Zingiber officinale]XP_042454317.1 pumilio homolog 3-like [Zingiber officinale]